MLVHAGLTAGFNGICCGDRHGQLLEYHPMNSLFETTMCVLHTSVIAVPASGAFLSGMPWHVWHVGRPGPSSSVVGIQL
jgi:hypothetical protein